MSDMVAYMGLDTAAYERGLRRAEQAAGGAGARIADAFVKQQKKSFEQMLGGNWGRAAMTGAAIGFGLLAKAQSDFAEKNLWAAESTKGLSRELSNLWDEIGGRATLAIAELNNLLNMQGMNGQGLVTGYRAFIGTLIPGSNDIGTIIFLAQMKQLERALAQQSAARDMLEKQEVRYLSMVEPEKARRLKAEIELREKLAAIAKMERDKELSKGAADAARARERGIFHETVNQVDPEWWRAQVEPINARREAAEDKKKKAQEERDERRRKLQQQQEDHRISRQELAMQQMKDAAELARMNKQEKRAAWLEYELDLSERMRQISQYTLTIEERREAIATARVQATAVLVAQLREMQDKKFLGGQSLGGGLYSQSLASQVFARNTQQADPQLKIAQDLLRAQLASASGIKEISDTARQILSVAKGGVKATFAP